MNSIVKQVRTFLWLEFVFSDTNSMQRRIRIKCIRKCSVGKGQEKAGKAQEKNMKITGKVQEKSGKSARKVQKKTGKVQEKVQGNNKKQYKDFM